MNKLIVALGLLFYASSCSAGDIKNSIRVTNSGLNDLTDYAVVLSRQQVEKKLGLLAANDVVYASLNGVATPSQCDDLDQDGKWDELAFLIDIKADSKVVVALIKVDAAQMPQFTKRTNIRFGHKNEPYTEVAGEPRLKSNDSPTISAIYQMEGPAWENDKVGFRNYYDARNGMDIFGKKTAKMVLDSIGIRNQNYHEMSPWGMDILKVANSLGAGSIALSINDLLYRIGPDAEGSYRFIAEGAVRAIFDFDFNNFKAGDRFYNVHQRISIYAGDCFYRSEVSVSDLKGDEKLVTGIVNKHNCALKTDDAGDMICYSTHGAQAYNGEILGLGLLVNKSDLASIKTSPMTGDGITETYLTYLNFAKKPVTHYFYSGWEYQDAGFKDGAYFANQLKKAALKISAKVTVK